MKEASLPVKVRPTIFIGLGGTGCRICTRLYERIQATSLPLAAKRRLPVIGIDSRRTKDTGIGNMNEYFGLSAIDLAEGTDRLVQALENLPKDEPDAIFYRNWHGGRAVNSPSFVDGCGQDRVNGRLLFQAFMRFYQGDKGVMRLKEYLMTLRRGMDINKNEEKSIILESGGAHVIVFAGAAGGTGSGLLLDVAYLVRSVFTTEGQSAGRLPLNRLTGIVLTDQVLSQSKTKSFAKDYADAMRQNTMASLAEIDFWGQPAVLGQEIVQYEAWWNGQDPVKQFGGNRPPLDDCYIIEGTTNDRRGLRSDEETYEFVADYFSDFFTDENLLTQFSSFGINFEDKLGVWTHSRSKATESPRFNRLGRFKLVVPLKEIQDYLLSKIMADAIEAAFEHRHSNPQDQNRFVEETTAKFSREHHFDDLESQQLLAGPDGQDLKRQAPRFMAALENIGDFDGFRNSLRTSSAGIEQNFKSRVTAKTDAWVSLLKERLKVTWLGAFSNPSSLERGRISARNTVCFLEEVSGRLEALQSRLLQAQPKEPSWSFADSDFNAWRGHFAKWALRTKSKGKFAKEQAAQRLTQLWNGAYDWRASQERIAYVRRSIRVVGNLLLQAHAITGWLTRPGGLKSEQVQRSGKAADVVAFLRTSVRSDLQVDSHVPRKLEDHGIALHELALRRIRDLPQSIGHRPSGDHVDVRTRADIHALEQNIANSHLRDVKVRDRHLHRQPCRVRPIQPLGNGKSQRPAADVIIVVPLLFRTANHLVIHLWENGGYTKEKRNAVVGQKADQVIS